MSSRMYFFQDDKPKFFLGRDADGSMHFSAQNDDESFTAWLSPESMAQLVTAVTAFTTQPVVVAVAEAA